MELAKIVCDAGILGAGGAGFPTHVKINCKAEYVLANGAECEPLLRVDQQVMQYYAADVVRGIRAVKEFTGAKHAVICLKEHYHEAVRALKEALKDADDVDSFLSGEEISFFDNSIKGLDDFELICFLVVRGEQ